MPLHPPPLTPTLNLCVWSNPSSFIKRFISLIAESVNETGAFIAVSIIFKYYCKNTDTQLKPETKSETENAELSNKQKIKALKRAIENKKYSLDRETEKCRTWRVQAKDRDEKATNEYQKRKKELEELLKKSEERYNKRIAKTKKWWWEYCVNFENTKIKKINDDLTLLQSELGKFEEHEPEVEPENAE